MRTLFRKESRFLQKKKKKEQVENADIFFCMQNLFEKINRNDVAVRTFYRQFVFFAFVFFAA